MSLFMQKVLEFSMLLENRSSRVLRFFGKITGAVPVWYAKRGMRRLKRGLYKQKSGRNRSSRYKNCSKKRK